MGKIKTVAVVVAHADDMEFMAGGTIARFIDEKGYDVYEYIMTDNSKGSYRMPAEELVQVSAVEAVEAGNVLGLKEVRLEGYRDSLLNQEQPDVLRRKVMGFLREIKADIVMSWDPFAPCEEHPDHRAVSMATLEAASFCNIPLFYPEDGNEPCTVTEAYWFAKSPWNAEVFVDISSTIDKKIAALLKHDCQMVLTVDGLVKEAEALGVEVPMLENLDEEGRRMVIDMGIRTFSTDVGQQAGLEFAEQFRYERFGMLERVMGKLFVERDF